jgi:hypothetical protein
MHIIETISYPPFPCYDRNTQAHNMNSTPISHNYYPPWITLPHYTPNESTVISLITRFGFQWGFVLGASFFLIGRLRPTASLSDRIAFTWMCLSMSIFTYIRPSSLFPITPLKTRIAKQQTPNISYINSGIHPPILRSPLRHQP